MGPWETFVRHFCFTHPCLFAKHAATLFSQGRGFAMLFSAIPTQPYTISSSFFFAGKSTTALPPLSIISINAHRSTLLLSPVFGGIT